MRYFMFVLLFSCILSCTKTKKDASFSTVKIETLYQDSLSIRAIEFVGNNLVFAGNNGIFGTIDLTTKQLKTSMKTYAHTIPEFRAVAHAGNDFFMLSVANPALLYKTGDNEQMELVYTEEGEGVFYDAMTFWNDNEGIAVGDSVNGCLSIIITRDGGLTWNKLSCDELPTGIDGEGAFAASNTNIKTVGDNTWIATTKRILFSSDKGVTWETFTTPIQTDKETQGIYSIDFYDEQLGVAVGGDYTEPESNTANKAITTDGGKTWSLVADGAHPGYKSCVQFVPNTNGKGIIALGFTGISYSNDTGANWAVLSKASFYTIRFRNDSIAYAAGKNGIAKLSFK